MNQLNPNLQTIEFVFRDTKLSIDRVANLDELVDQVSDDEFNKDERLPYWAELWPSAIGLSRFIIKNPDLFNSKNILELGCGLGLTSLVLMQQNPALLLCTDYENDALKLTRRNFIKNNLKLPYFEQIDWRNPLLDTRYELIIASDILYENRFFQPLQKLFRNYLQANGQIIVAEPNRSVAIPFFDVLKEYGYNYSIQFEEVDQDGKTIVISIYIISRMM